MTPGLLADAVQAAYWLCSAIAQAFAALTALTGLFAVYRLQSIRQEKDDIGTHMLSALRRARDRINSQAGTQVGRIDDEPVPAVGEHGWVEILSTYDSGYAPKLVLMKNIGGDRARWAEGMERFFPDTFKQREDMTSDENECKRWATILTIADGLVTLGSLAVIPSISRLGRAIAPTMSVVLGLASLALLLTLYACISILRGGYAWPLKSRTVGANKQALDSARES